MSENTITLNSKTKDAAYYIKSIIGLAIMVFFGFLPAPAPITHAGMVLLGQFIGLIFLWTAVDMVWPTFAAIICFGFIATDIYPNSFALASVYEAGMQSWGNWCVLIAFGLLLLGEVLSDTGLIRRIALAFITSKTAKKGPWHFTFMFILSAFIIGLFMDCTGTQLLIFALATEVFQILGIAKEDKWAKVVSIGMTFAIIFAFGATPFCHTMPLLFMGIYAGIAGTAINWLSYMAVTVPIAIILFAVQFLFFKLIVKPDMSKIANIDMEKIEALKTGPMSAKEKFVAVVSALLVICWFLPGLLGVIAPNNGLFLFLDGITMLTPLLFVLVLFAIVRFDGKPVLDIAQACTKINWLVIFLLAGIMMIASAMGEDTTGLSAWVMGAIGPLFANMSGFAMVATICVISVIFTNIANNIPVGIVLVIVGTPIAMEKGINPLLVALAVSYCANLAFTIPPAFVPVGTVYAYPYGGGKYTLRWGLVACLYAIIISVLLVYPLGTLFC